MSFKTLESRFNETVNKLYAGATYKFNDGRASNGRTDEPYIVRRPGESQKGINIEGRGLPFVSTAQDVKRLTLFQISRRGILFLVKQQLLQTGNTFEHTRIINPLFAVGNAVPFLHIRRTLRPLAIGGTVGKVLSLIGITKNATPKSPRDLRKIGQLQQETYDKWNGGSGLVKSLIKKIPVIGQTASAFRAKRSMGDSPDGWTYTRPELGKNNSEYFVYRYNADTAPGATDSKLLRQLIKFVTKLDIGGNDGVGYGAIKANGKYVTYLNYSNDKSTWERLIQTDYATYRLAKYKKAVLPERSEVAIQSGTKVLADIKEEYRTASDYQKLLNSQIEDTAYLSYDRDNNQKYKAADGLLFASLSPKNVSVPTLNKDLSVIYGTGKIRSREGETRENVNTGREAIDSQRTKSDFVVNRGKTPYLKYFTGDPESITAASQFDPSNVDSTNAKYLAEFRTNKSKKISYIKDPLNVEVEPDAGLRTPYRRLPNTGEKGATPKDDIITVSFAMGADKHVQFRAFLKDLQQTISPKYSEYQYIGRTEKFITYTSVQREVSFKLGIIAYAESELEVVWTRINYLTGLAFPYGFNRGLFSPNIMRMTIGDVYVDQPAYIASLNTDFSGITETWEISNGKQVPISALMNISVVLIEKNTKIAESPFYGITEKLSDRFSETLQTPGDAPSQDDTIQKSPIENKESLSRFPDIPAFGTSDTSVFPKSRPTPNNR